MSEEQGIPKPKRTCYIRTNQDSFMIKAEGYYMDDRGVKFMANNRIVCFVTYESLSYFEDKTNE